MKRSLRMIAAVALVVTCVGLTGTVLYAVMNAGATQPQHTVCLQSHTQIVMVPIGCGKGVLCEAPVVTEICDRIGPQPSRTPHQGNQDDD